MISEAIRNAATIGQQPLNETILAEIVNREARIKLSDTFEVGRVSLIKIFENVDNPIAKFKLPIKHLLQESEMDLPELWHVRLIRSCENGCFKGTLQNELYATGCDGRW
ncbi:hypothetical protein AHF37_08807 [Paragonimus kellicotti]|nr:hypothetical protein AHF37_08807 [Paragonimus kellicotti]